MKTVHLIRHSKSSWSIDGLDDCDRPLKGRGIRDAHLVSQFFKNEIAHPNELIWYSSSAVRALHTALIFARNMEVKEKNIIIDKSLYHCDAEQILRSIQAVPEHYDSAIFFAHNPALTEVVNQITKASINNVPTTGLVSIRFDCDKWKHAGSGAELIQFQYPKGLKR